MKKTEFNPTSYCGLYCGSCPVYMATEDEKTDEIGGHSCNGCKSDNVSGWCQSCNIKLCCREKSIESCVECREYPCRVLEEFKNDKNCEYHIEVYDSLEILKNNGLDRWKERMAKRWRCISCDSRYNWWQTECKKCGSKVEGYIQP